MLQISVQSSLGTKALEILQTLNNIRQKKNKTTNTINIQFIIEDSLIH